MKPRDPRNAGSARTSLLLAALSCCVTASATDANYRYFRFTPVKLRNDTTSNSIQVAEFNFLHGGTPLVMTGVTATNPGGNTPAAEGAVNLVDGNTATKWLDFYKNPVVFDFGVSTTIDGYRFTTANDAAERDPLRWTLEGSPDGATWTLLDHTTADFATPTNRLTATTDILLPATPAPIVMTWTGAESADWNTTATNWNNGAGAIWDNASFDLARFDGTGPATVSLGEGITARALDFTAAGHLVQNNTLTLTGVTRLTGSAAGEISSTIAGTVGLVKTGSSTLTLSGENTYTGGTSVRGGTLILSGGNAYTGGTSVAGDGTLSFTGAATKTAAAGLVVGDTAGRGTMILSDNSSVAFNGTPSIGAGTGGAGLVRQTGGTATFAQDGQYLTLGNGTGTYGSYELSGGSLSTVAFAGFRIGFGGTGVLTQTGGSLSSGRWFAVAGANAKGTATFTGGTASVASGYRFIAGDAAGADGVINIGTAAGGNAVVTGLRTATGANDGAMVVSGNAASTGVLNLNSGTLKLHARIYRAGGQGFVNLNGGTLQAGIDNVELMNDSLSAALLYRGGVDVDTNGFNASISTSIFTAFENGVYPAGGGYAVGSGGSGYLGAPVVTVTSDGFGSGIRAVATVAGGAVTGVTLTCPGENYQVGDTLTFAFTGGGSGVAAPDFQHVLTAGDLMPNDTGTFTKSGIGTLTLSGNSAYTGPTRVLAGSLAANGTLAETAVTVSPGATLTGELDTAGPVVIQGTLAPGAGVGSAVGLSSLQLSAGSTYAMQIGDWNGAAGTGHDTAGFSSLSIDATAGNKLTIHVDGTGMTGFSEAARDFVIVSADSAPAGLAADNWQVTTTGFPGFGTWSLAANGNTLVLSYTPSAGGYGTWVNGFPGLTDTSEEGDPDFDGVKTLMEYVLDGNPGTPEPVNLPEGEASAGNFVFSYVRRTESKADTTQIFQYGNSLTGWTDVAIPAASAGTVAIAPDTPSAGLETVTITVAAPGDRLFGRLTATRP